MCMPFNKAHPYLYVHICTFMHVRIYIDILMCVCIYGCVCHLIKCVYAYWSSGLHGYCELFRNEKIFWAISSLTISVIYAPFLFLMPLMIVEGICVPYD